MRQTAVVTASDQAFLPGLRALVRSLNRHCPSRPLYVLDCGIADSDKRLLADCHSHLHFEELRQLELTGLPAPAVGSYATYARLLIGLIFGTHDRLIYLDADTIVLQDLAPLDDVILRRPDSAVAACIEPYTPTFDSLNGVFDHDKLGIPPATPYFNAGVMVVDVGRWNTFCVMDSALSYLRRGDVRISMFDQEALNVALVGRWEPLVPEWNVSRYWVHEKRRVSRPDILNQAKILHFLSPEKPWIAPEKVDPWLLQKFREYE